MDSSTTFLKHAGHELTRKHPGREPQNADHAGGRRDDRVDLSQVEVVDDGQLIALPAPTSHVARSRPPAGAKTSTRSIARDSDLRTLRPPRICMGIPVIEVEIGGQASTLPTSEQDRQESHSARMTPVLTGLESRDLSGATRQTVIRSGASFLDQKGLNGLP